MAFTRGFYAQALLRLPSMLVKSYFRLILKKLVSFVVNILCLFCAPFQKISAHSPVDLSRSSVEQFEDHPTRPTSLQFSIITISISYHYSPISIAHARLDSKSNLYDTRGITPKRVASGWAHLHVLAPGQHSS